jgi:hypothetical protein
MTIDVECQMSHYICASRRAYITTFPLPVTRRHLATHNRIARHEKAREKAWPGFRREIVLYTTLEGKDAAHLDKSTTINGSVRETPCFRRVFVSMTLKNRGLQ